MAASKFFKNILHKLFCVDFQVILVICKVIKFFLLHKLLITHFLTFSSAVITVFWFFWWLFLFLKLLSAFMMQKIEILKFSGVHHDMLALASNLIAKMLYCINIWILLVTEYRQLDLICWCITVVFGILLEN